MDKIKTYISDERSVKNHFYFTSRYMTVAFSNEKIDLMRVKNGYILCNPKDGIPYLHEKPVSYVEDLNISLRKFDLPVFDLDYSKFMEHTNEIAIQILKEAHWDYKTKPENRWHYDDEYKRLVKAIELSKAEAEFESKSSVFSVSDIGGQGMRDNGLLGVFDTREKALESVNGDTRYPIKEIKLNVLHPNGIN